MVETEGMSEEIIIGEIKLGPHHIPTGKTAHYRGGSELPKPDHLKLVQYSGDPGYYLLYFDYEGNELTDTYHDTIESALDQANWEFRVKPEEWQMNSM